MQTGMEDKLIAPEVWENINFLNNLYSDSVFITITGDEFVTSKDTYKNTLMSAIEKCDECWFFGSHFSPLMERTRSYCAARGIMYKILGNFDNWPKRKVCFKTAGCDSDCLSCEFFDEDDNGISCWLLAKKLKGETVI